MQYSDILVFLLFIISCSQKYRVIKSFPITPNDIIDTQKAIFVPEKSKDNNGCLLINSKDGRSKMHLYKMANIGKLKNIYLVYRLYANTVDFKAEAYPELLYKINDRDLFSRALDNKITHNKAWKPYKSSFYFKKGELPQIIELNLIVYGKGISIISS